MVAKFLLLVVVAGQSRPIIDLHGEVMACGYEDVQVMWSILHKSPGQECAV